MLFRNNTINGVVSKKLGLAATGGLRPSGRTRSLSPPLARRAWGPARVLHGEQQGGGPHQVERGPGAVQERRERRVRHRQRRQLARLTLLVRPLKVPKNCARVIFGSFRISRSTRCANRSVLYQCGGIGRPGVHLVIGRFWADLRPVPRS